VDTTKSQRKRDTWRRDLEKEMWTAGYKYSWRKMEAAAQTHPALDGNMWAVDYVPLGVTRHKSGQLKSLISVTYTQERHIIPQTVNF